MEKGFGWAMTNLFLVILNASVMLGSYFAIHHGMDAGFWVFTSLAALHLYAATKMVVFIQHSRAL